MTHPEFIAYLKEQLNYAHDAVQTDHDHARNYAYKAVCEDIYHTGHEARQESAKQAARFHDGRAKGHGSCASTIYDILQKAESLGKDLVDKTP